MNNFFYYKKSTQLYVGKCAISDITRKTGTPVYIYSAESIISRVKSYQEGLKKYRHIIAYALKANSNGEIIRLVSKLGCGADITSGGELYRALKGGVKPSKIVYAGVGKTADEMRYALKSGILMFNVESWPEVVLLDSIAASMRLKARIAVRINPDVDARTHKKITTGRSGTKFGIPISEAIDFYVAASRLKNIEIVGIHSHIGSQITSSTPFVIAAKKIRELIRHIENKGIKISYVDLGGGLGITYRYGIDKPPAPEDFVKDVLAVFSKDDFKNRTFIFEPGRSIVGESGSLVSSVIYHKKVLGKNFIITDAAMSDLIRPTLYDAYHEILPVVKPKNYVGIKADVVGPICETGDFVGLGRELPELKSGDLLAIMSAGAYGYAMSSQYNSRPRSPEVMVYPDGKFRLIRRRETYQDLVRTELVD